MSRSANRSRFFAFETSAPTLQHVTHFRDLDESDDEIALFRRKLQNMCRRRSENLSKDRIEFGIIFVISQYALSNHLEALRHQPLLIFF